MKNLLLKDGDFLLSKGDVLLVDGDAELAQTLRTELETAKGEWFLDVDMGLDREPFESKPTNEEAIRTALIDVITSHPQIESVETIDLALNKSTRTLLVSFVALKLDGDTIALEEVALNGG